MAIYKPSWLRDALNLLNWDIFTWHVYVGDAIENGIDWVIEGINWVIYQGEQAWNRAVAAWDKAVEVGINAWNNLQFEASKLWAKIDTWLSDLETWWGGKTTLIQGWINAAQSFLLGLYNNLGLQLNALSVALSNFWTTTWPQLLSNFNAWVVKVGNFFTVTLPGLAEKLDITKAFNDFRLEWKDLFNFWGSTGKTVTTFFLNPLDWVKDRIETWFWGEEK